MTIVEAGEILGAWGITVRGVERVAKGSVNSNFAVDSSRGRLFLRVFEEQGEEGAGREGRLVAHLAARGVPTPAPLGTLDGRTWVLHGGKPVALFPWVEGEELCQARVGAPAAREVGAALARLHLAGQSFAERHAGRFEAADLERRVRAIPEGALAEIGLREDLLGELARPMPGPLPDLPSGVIHGDLFRDNVLWKPGSDRIAALLDFESASYGAWAYDLAVTLLAWTYGDRFEPELVRALVAGYESERPLGGEERAALGRCARRAATRFIITRITDFHLRAPASGARKDYRRFLARRAAVATELLPLLPPP